MLQLMPLARAFGQLDLPEVGRALADVALRPPVYSKPERHIPDGRVLLAL